MKKLIYFVLRGWFGKEKFYRFFLVLKNIGLEGLNYRNSDITQNGELYLINRLSCFYKNKKDLIFFDVGANIGNYSRVLATTFHHSTIYAFEPFSVPYTSLKKLSESFVTVKPNKIGLSDKEEELPIYSSDDFSEIGGLYNRTTIYKEISLDKKELNQFKTITSFSKEHGITHIHFLKIDVEGHELSVLKGGMEFLNSTAIDFIQFEFGAGNNFSKTYFLDFHTLLSSNYILCRLLKDGLVPIKEYDPDLEILVLANFVAISKKLVPVFFTKEHAA